MIWFLFFWRVEPVKSRQLAHVATNQAELWWQASLCIFLTLGSWLARVFCLVKVWTLWRRMRAFSHWDNNISELSPFVDAICLVIGPKSKLLVHSAAYSAASRSTKKWLSSCRSARGERHQITMNWTNEGCSAGHVPGIFQLIWFSKKHSMVLNPNQACQSYVTLFKNSYKDLDLAWFHLAWFHGDVSAEIHEKMTPILVTRL